MKRFLLAALLLVPVTQAGADFYKYVGEDGVESFTNIPTNGKVQRVLREKKTERKKAVSDAVAKTAVSTALPEADLGAAGVVLPVHGSVTSGYGWRHDPIDGSLRHHEGVDIAVPSGTPVKCIAAGRVVFSGVRGGYGNLVIVDHGNGMSSLYGHNARLAAAVGEQVQAGQTVAYSGATGRCTGPHLHFELWRSGLNDTEAYLRGSTDIPDQAGGIRSYLHADGSIVFTNY